LVNCDVISPVLEEFRPQLLLVSTGFDAHERDPLASTRWRRHAGVDADDGERLYCHPGIASRRRIAPRALELATEEG
jgi:hypothetical protein